MRRVLASDKDIFFGPAKELLLKVAKRLGTVGPATAIADAPPRDATATAPDAAVPKAASIEEAEEAEEAESAAFDMVVEEAASALQEAIEKVAEEAAASEEASELHEKHWKERVGTRKLSSEFRPKKPKKRKERKERKELEEARPKLSYSLTRVLSGIEKDCLLKRGALELKPELPEEEVTPLGEDDAFKKNSALESFWRALHRKIKNMPGNECYFVFVKDERCDAIAWLKSAPKRQDVKVIELHGLCSRVSGVGAIFVYKLCHYLHFIEPQTQLRIVCKTCWIHAAPFYEKFGFVQCKGGKVSAGDHMLLNLWEQKWQSYPLQQVGGKSDATLQLLREHASCTVQADAAIAEKFWAHARHGRATRNGDAVITEARKSKDVAGPVAGAVAGPSTSSIDVEVEMTKDGAGPSTIDDDVIEVKANEVTIADVEAKIAASINLLNFPESVVGKRCTVRGNGSCWIYAIMAGLQILEHANPCKITQLRQAEKVPTERDYEVSARLLDKMKSHLKLSMTRFFKSGDDKKRITDDMDAFVAATPTTAGSFGGGFENFAILANMLEVQIFRINKNKPERFMLWTGNSAGKMIEHPIEVFTDVYQQAKREKENILLVEFDGVNHFAGYVPAADWSPELPFWLSRLVDHHR